MALEIDLICEKRPFQHMFSVIIGSDGNETCLSSEFRFRSCAEDVLLRASLDEKRNIMVGIMVRHDKGSVS